MAKLVLRHRAFMAVQRRGEIARLLERLRRNPPRRVCEIGSLNGGTVCLFAQVASTDAQLLCIDPGLTPLRAAAIGGLARPGQRITCLIGDSRAAATVQGVRDWLGDERLDFLFIDGDHSLPAVADDFAVYAPLVRDGGLIALHDIVPDSRTRGGVTTISHVGDVPAFWSQLKGRGHVTHELIDDPEQDGMGIGVIEWRATIWAR